MVKYKYVSHLFSKSRFDLEKGCESQQRTELKTVSSHLTVE